MGLYIYLFSPPVDNCVDVVDRILVSGLIAWVPISVAVIIPIKLKTIPYQGHESIGYLKVDGRQAHRYIETWAHT